MKRPFSLGLFALLLATDISAQSQQDGLLPCRNNDLEMVAPLHTFSAEQLAAMAADDAALEQFTAEFEEAFAPGQRSGIIIPVVFHIIHNNGPENISDAQIEDAMRVLNLDFNKQNADWQNVRPEFLDIVGDVGVEFRLAKKDPQGNCTRGITRTQSALTNDGTQTMKNLIQWPRNRYLNVWVAASANGAAGYTYRPGAVNNQPTWDGIVLLHTYTGSIGTSSPGRSRTLTHEVGHWINLAHTWGNTNEPAIASNCNDDDGVTDTPNSIGWTVCNLSGVSCGSLDNVENYMDYSYCSKMFTNGQATRMLAALNSGTSQRNQLWSASNLTFTGVELENQLCAAQFESSTRSTCQGSSVTFTDLSFHDVTERTWSFPGAEPSTSTEANPTVVYTETGVFPVTLTVSNGGTTLTSSQTNYITVQSNPGAPTPLEEGFENVSSLTSSPWAVVNPDNNNTFTLTTAAAFSGSNSVRILNTANMSGQKDDLISETYDLSSANEAIITYRYAYAQRNTSNDDRLRVYVSNNCGNTWSMRQQLRGINSLNTGGTVTGSFVPTAEQWGFSTVNNISPSFLTSNFRVRFEFESAGGNNVYIDDININGAPVSVGEQLLGSGEALVVVPNPATDAAQAVFNLAEAGQVRMELVDVLGRSIAVLDNGQRAAGTHRIDLPIGGLQSGLYFVRMQQGTKTQVVRFVVK